MKIALALTLLVVGCATQPAPAPAEPAPPAAPSPPADQPPRGKVVETTTTTTTRTERFSVNLPDDLESDIPCGATSVDRFMAALFVRVRNRLELPRGYQALMPGRPAAATVRVVIDVPASGEPIAAKLTGPSGVEALDRAVLAAVEKAKCVPPPPARMMDPKTGTFRIIEPFGFERAN
jgi:TonB family protein